MADIKAEYLACPIREVISRFGDKWSLLVLFLLNRSDTGVLRFNEMRRFMTDCSQKMLSQTLKNLEQSHLVHREVFPEVPPRVEYSLTETGRSLMPALSALIDGDASLILELAAHIDEHAFANDGVLAAIGMKRREHAYRLGNFAPP